MKCKNEEANIGYVPSPSLRRVWVEMTAALNGMSDSMSPSLRRVWVEMLQNKQELLEDTVTLLAEGVG